MSSDLNGLSGQIIAAAIEVHKELGGPGLLESVYEEALAVELGLCGLECRRQVPVRLGYKGAALKSLLFIDLLVEDTIVVEVKAVEKYNSIYQSQLLTYLRLGGYQLGLVINFGERVVKNGIHRVINSLE